MNISAETSQSLVNKCYTNVDQNSTVIHNVYPQSQQNLKIKTSKNPLNKGFLNKKKKKSEQKDNSLWTNSKSYPQICYNFEKDLTFEKVGR